MRLHLNSLRKVQTIRQVCDRAAKFCDGAATKMDKTLPSDRVAHSSLKIGAVVSTQR